MHSDPDEIHFNCPKCKRPMSGDKALLNEMITCPDCGAAFIPTPRKPEPKTTQENSQRAKQPPPKTTPIKPRYWLESVVLAAIGIGFFFGGIVFFASETFAGIGFVSLIGLGLFVYAFAKWIWCIGREKPRLAAWVLLAMGIVGFFGFKSWRDSHTGYVSYAQRLDRYRAVAEQAVRINCTNHVIGLRQFIRMDVSTYDQNVKQWKASATVEYINHLGGIDRTNLEFEFDTFGGDLICSKKEPPWH